MNSAENAYFAVRMSQQSPILLGYGDNIPTAPKRPPPILSPEGRLSQPAVFSPPKRPPPTLHQRGTSNHAHQPKRPPPSFPCAISSSSDMLHHSKALSVAPCFRSSNRSSLPATQSTSTASAHDEVVNTAKKKCKPPPPMLPTSLPTVVISDDEDEPGSRDISMADVDNAPAHERHALPVPSLPPAHATESSVKCLTKHDNDVPPVRQSACSKPPPPTLPAPLKTSDFPSIVVRENAPKQSPPLLPSSLLVERKRRSNTNVRTQYDVHVDVDEYPGFIHWHGAKRLLHGEPISSVLRPCHRR